MPSWYDDVTRKSGAPVFSDMMVRCGAKMDSRSKLQKVDPKFEMLVKIFEFSRFFYQLFWYGRRSTNKTGSQ